MGKVSQRSRRTAKGIAAVGNAVYERRSAILFSLVAKLTANFDTVLHDPSSIEDGCRKFRNQDQEDAAMTHSKTIISAAMLSGMMFFGYSGASAAGDAGAIQTFKPLQSVTIDAGQKHGIGYFLSESDTCKLVLTLTDKQEEPRDLTVTRFETAVPAGGSTRYTSEEGRSFEFGCQVHADAMTLKPLNSVASTQGE